MSEITAVPLRPVKKGAVTRLWVGLGAVILAAGATAWAGTSKSIAVNGTNEEFLAWHKAQAGVVTTASGLQYQVLREGTGPHPTDADVGLVMYKGTLRDGTVFDQSEKPVPFPVAQVVPGFSEALKLMSKGAKYRIWLPPELGYGERSPDPKIPANSVLVFDVELTDFQNLAALQAQMQAMQQLQQGRAAEGAPR